MSNSSVGIVGGFDTTGSVGKPSTASTLFENAEDDGKEDKTENHRRNDNPDLGNTERRYLYTAVAASTGYRA